MKAVRTRREILNDLDNLTLKQVMTDSPRYKKLMKELTSVEENKL